MHRDHNPRLRFSVIQCNETRTFAVKGGEALTSLGAQTRRNVAELEVCQELKSLVRRQEAIGRTIAYPNHVTRGSCNVHQKRGNQARFGLFDGLNVED